MKLLTNVLELEGKTIKEVVDNWDELIFIFKGGSCAVFEINSIYDDRIIQLKTELDDLRKVELGILSEREYNKLKDAEVKKQQEAQEKYEREELARLQAKYQSGTES